LVYNPAVKMRTRFKFSYSTKTSQTFQLIFFVTLSLRTTTYWLNLSLVSLTPTGSLTHYSVLLMLLKALYILYRENLFPLWEQTHKPHYTKSIN